MRRRVLATGMSVLLYVSGCDESFTPLVARDLELSVFGYLDASADTQWIRVMPIRTVIVTRPDTFPVSVTLEQLGRGREIPLRDSVFEFRQYHYPEAGIEGIYVHNFWTTERIEPGGRYRLRIERPGRAVSEALVAVPERYAVEVWIRQGLHPGRDSLHLAGVRHVPFARSQVRFRDCCGEFDESRALAVPGGRNDRYTIPIVPPAAVPRGAACEQPLAGESVLWAVGSEAEWPSGQGYSTSALVPWEGGTNVTHALGYVGGVVTISVPYETCELLGPVPQPGYCRLRYDSASAALLGRVQETRCGDGALKGISLSLTELVADGTGYRKVRRTVTDAAGEFRIQGLEAGRRYALATEPMAGRLMDGGSAVKYLPYSTTTEFRPGERRHVDIELERGDADCATRWRDDRPCRQVVGARAAGRVSGWSEQDVASCR